VRRASYRALARRDRVVDVRQLPRAMAVPPRGRRARPVPLDLDAPIAWVRGTALPDNAPIWVPLEAVTLDTAFHRPPRFDVSSNGLASGNALVEAVLHGLCEVIERDAEAAWRRSGGDRRLVLDTIVDATCSQMIEAITRTGARVFLWDLTGELGVAVIGCAIVEDPAAPSWRPLGCYQGFGCHLAPEIAIARALAEAAQTRITYIAGARDDFFPFDYARATDPDAVAALWQQAAAPCDDPALFDDLPRIAAPSLGAAVVELVARAGQVIAVDLTHPAIGAPVVKVIVPGRATDVEALG